MSFVFSRKSASIFFFLLFVLIVLARKAHQELHYHLRHPPSIVVVMKADFKEETGVKKAFFAASPPFSQCVFVFHIESPMNA